MKCKTCGHELRDGTKFCPACGSQVDTDASKTKLHRCPYCGGMIKAGSHFCPQCGSLLVTKIIHGESKTEADNKSESAAETEPRLEEQTICPLCKREVQKGLRSCPYCGNVLEPEGSESDKSPVEPAKVHERIRTGKHLSRWGKTAVIFLILALAAGVGGAWIGTQLPANNNTEDQTVSDDSPENDMDGETKLQQDPSADETDNTNSETQETNDSENSETATKQDYLLPESDSRYISKSELGGFTKEECRIARNEIYARHGRMFDDESLQAYFDSLDWYSPSIAPDDFDESSLNDYERANLDLIIAYETEQGYR